MATHSRKGNTRASGRAVAQGPSGKVIKVSPVAGLRYFGFTPGRVILLLLLIAGATPLTSEGGLEKPVDRGSRE
jgi:hypothetical protein